MMLQKNVIQPTGVADFHFSLFDMYNAPGYLSDGIMAVLPGTELHASVYCPVDLEVRPDFSSDWYPLPGGANLAFERGFKRVYIRLGRFRYSKVHLVGGDCLWDLTTSNVPELALPLMWTPEKPTSPSEILHLNLYTVSTRPLPSHVAGVVSDEIVFDTIEPTPGSNVIVLGSVLSPAALEAADCISLEFEKVAEVAHTRANTLDAQEFRLVRAGGVDNYHPSDSRRIGVAVSGATCANYKPIYYARIVWEGPFSPLDRIVAYNINGGFASKGDFNSILRLHRHRIAAGAAIRFKSWHRVEEGEPLAEVLHNMEIGWALQVAPICHTDFSSNVSGVAAGTVGMSTWANDDEGTPWLEYSSLAAAFYRRDMQAGQYSAGMVYLDNLSINVGGYLNAHLQVREVLQ